MDAILPPPPTTPRTRRTTSPRQPRKSPSTAVAVATMTATTVTTPSGSGASPSRSGRLSKPKKLPTVTPRRFNRFFAPRHGLEDAQSAHAARSARAPLGDISYSGANRRHVASSPIRKSRRLLDQDEDLLPSLDSTPEKPSPLKRVCLTHPSDRPAARPHFFTQDIPSSPPAYHEPVAPQLPQPVRKSRFRSAYGANSARELGLSTSAERGTRPVLYNTKWQSETFNYYSRPQDVHHTYSCMQNQRWKKAVPFSVATCHKESIIAVSDEEGFIRLMDSEKDSSHSFDTAIVEMLAHKNAILDLEFSEDDYRLVTAAGDRTALVIDVQRQESLYTMFGHSASLRQVRFQPGSSGNVIASAGRDGMIKIWDLRCKPETLPNPRSNRSSQSGLGTVESRRYAQWIHSFMPPNLNPKDPSRKYSAAGSVEMSVTAMSFLSADRPEMIMSGSATSAGISLWDMRNMRTKQISSQNALVTTAWPASDARNYRGVVAMALSGDARRVYALCKDSTVYAYSTAEMLVRSHRVDALYGFRNPALQVTSFYAGLAVRPASQATGGRELLAVTGGAAGPVTIPTDETYLAQYGGVVEHSEVRSGVRIYRHGSVLRHGHTADLCDVAFTNQGNLISVGDDSRVRVWYEDAAAAAEMRAKAKTPGEDVRGMAWSEPAFEKDADYLMEDEEY